MRYQRCLMSHEQTVGVVQVDDYKAQHQSSACFSSEILSDDPYPGKVQARDFTFGGDVFLRLKIGINSEYNNDTKSFVLSNFSKKELESIDILFKESKKIINDFITGNDFITLSNKYGNKIRKVIS